MSLIASGKPTKRAPDAGESARFTSIFLASSFFCSQAESTPAHLRVTQTVGLHLTYIMKMPKYIFLDNWVYSLLTDAENERRLSAFLHHQGYTILTTSLSFVELYNPNWENAGDKDRMNRTAHFLSKNLSVIVDPEKVWKAEIKLYPNPVSSLPIELDLESISDNLRSLTLLSFLKGDNLFIQQGKNIEQWREQYDRTKATWFDDVENIIEHACQTGYLKRNKKGKFIELQQLKEIFLFSLDFRLAEADKIDTLLSKLVEKAKSGEMAQLTSIRLSSLCFWYSYVNIDQANRMKRNESDIGDFYHISLLPYCSAFTTDGSMYRMLKRINEPIKSTNCEVITHQKLDKILSKY